MPVTTAIIFVSGQILLAPFLLICFCKRWVATFNLAATKRIAGRFVARLPGFGILRT